MWNTIRVTVTVAPLLIAAFAVPSPAEAYVPDTPPCYGHTCVGQNPNVENRDHETCATGVPGSNNGAVDVAQSTITPFGGSGSVTLRYSAFCGANWARWTYNGDSVNDYWAETWDGRTTERAHGGGTQKAYYTTMLDGTQLARVWITQINTGLSPAHSAWF